MGEIEEDTVEASNSVRWLRAHAHVPYKRLNYNILHNCDYIPISKFAPLKGIYGRDQCVCKLLIPSKGIKNVFSPLVDWLRNDGYESI